MKALSRLFSTQPKPYRPHLTMLPTPIGNLKDISFNTLKTLNECDVLICENRKKSKILLKAIKDKNIEQIVKDALGKYIDVAQLGGEKSKEQLEEEAKRDFIKKHPNLVEIRREKQRLRELQDKEDFQDMLKTSRDILKDLDSFRFYSPNQDPDVSSPIYDSSSTETPGGSTIYGLDSPLVTHLLEERNKGGPYMIYLPHLPQPGFLNSLKALILANMRVCLVSDAGTPTISDPGYNVANFLLKENIKVTSEIGPSSIDIALISSGFPRDRYFFQGFLNKLQKEREEELLLIRERGHTTVIFEGKSRVDSTVRSIRKIFGDKQIIFIGVEMTKLHERLIRGEVGRIIENMIDGKIGIKGAMFKGEVTIVIPPRTKAYNDEVEVFIPNLSKDSYQITERQLALTLKGIFSHLPNHFLSDLLAKIAKMPKKRAYKLIENREGSLKRRLVTKVDSDIMDTIKEDLKDENPLLPLLSATAKLNKQNKDIADRK